MLIKSIRRYLPRTVRNSLRRRAESKVLTRMPRASCDTSNLTVTTAKLEPQHDWSDVAPLANIIQDKAGAVNAGDRQALFALTRTLKAKRVLEIGTNVGGSTVMFALALKGAPGAKVTTVDIVDVNGPAGPAAQNSVPYPIEGLKQAGCESLVEFVTSDSIAFLRDCHDRFDLIFLDGAHYAQQVYAEVPLALKRLNPNGLILLHDYFPHLQPLWDTGNVIPGPWLAIERLRHEGVNVKAVPLGALPWPTKRDSNVSSLAYLVRVP